MNESVLQVTCIGTKARDLIARLDFSGQVFTVVSNAAYVIASEAKQSPAKTEIASSRREAFDSAPLLVMTGEQQEVIWLAQNEVRHQRAVLCSFDARALRVGMRFDNTMLNWTDASIWHSTTITRDQVAVREMVSARVREWVGLLDAPRGFAQFIPLMRSDAAIESISDPLINSAANPVIEIVHAWRDRDMARALESSRALVGLGYGLTPSGDDFIGGMLFAAQCLNIAYPGLLNWQQQSIDDLLAWARDKTNAISYAILRDHADGQSVDALHNLMHALLTGKVLDELLRFVRHLVGIGNTSGWDMLGGAMASLLSVAPELSST